MDISRYIAQVKIDNCATVRVLRISPEETIMCDRKCASLEESAKDGSLQCYIGWIKKMVNFQTTALIIDYEIILERKSDWDWSVCAAHFPIIDDAGVIHEGEFICKSIISPERLRGADKLYPGTKGQYRIYYESFPKGGKVASIIVDVIGNRKGRIDLLTSEHPEFDSGEEEKSPVDGPTLMDDLLERVKILEKQMGRLRPEFDSLRLTLASKGVIPYKHKEKPMSDPGIEYHPLDKK